MAFILNEYEIEELAEKQIFGATILKRFVDMINSNSDGWAFWRMGANAATQLQTLVKYESEALKDRCPILQRSEMEKRITKALSPMKSLCTRRNLPTDWIEGIL